VAIVRYSLVQLAKFPSGCVCSGLFCVGL